MIQYEDGLIMKINADDKTQQESILKRLLTPDDRNRGFRGVKMVSISFSKYIFSVFFLNWNVVKKHQNSYERKYKFWRNFKITL